MLPKIYCEKIQFLFDMLLSLAWLRFNWIIIFNPLKTEKIHKKCSATNNKPKNITKFVCFLLLYSFLIKI